MKKLFVADFTGFRRILTSLLLFSAFTLTSLSGAVYAAAENASVPDVRTLNVSLINTAMDSIFLKYGSLTQITDPGDIAAYRWLANAKFYVEQSSTSSLPEAVTAVSNTMVINAVMDNIFEKYGSLTKISDPGDVATYRWLALAKAYEK
jgi:hypothetical protein